MGRKVLISFLGTGNYKECVYSRKGENSRVVKYIQTAIVELLAPNFDNYIVFCTEGAYDKHFKSLNEENNGIFKDVKIPNGFSEDEIWKIFQIIFETLEDNDSVVFDITHSFRSLPMLGITLLQYAKFIKNINVEGIYYGAFENLGVAYEIEEKYPNPESRIAPILDLTSFSALQDWSQYGSQFVNTGNVSGLKKMVSDSLAPILREAKGADKEASKAKKINENLSKISLDFSTNRGKEIWKGTTLVELKEDMKSLDSSVLPAFTPILKKIENQLSGFAENSYEENCFASVRWCLDKGLIQQGITQLQEFVVSLLLFKLNESHTNKSKREIMSAYLGMGHSTSKQEWSKALKGKNADEFFQKNEEEIKSIHNLDSIVKNYQSLKDARNDINHNGMTDKTINSIKFREKLEKSLVELEKLFKNAH